MPVTPSTRVPELQAEKHIRHGRALLAQEIEGLKALLDSLDQYFAQAVETIANTCHGEGAAGRLIVTGMGKSGHIGRKIAATMASTGTPAHFVHPGEASHGDLGMITEQDCVLALSNSGETRELTDIITHCKRFHIPLIGMVRRKSSMLVEAADVPLVLPDTPEAPPTDAPTTSTTMMLALGDALAVALIERRGFTKEDFSVFHPGGKLGKAFVRVKELMHGKSELPLVTEIAPMQDVLIEMTAKRFGCAGVVNGKGQLIGVITDGDLRRHMESGLLTRNAREVMTAHPLTIRPGALAVEALALMNEKSVTTLFVSEQDTPEGILHVHDILRAGVA